MLLIYTQKVTPRIQYVFKHIMTRILGIKIEFTSTIENFISHTGPKVSYGKKPMGNEFYIYANGLLTQQGFETIDITVKEWEETKCFFLATEKSAIPFDIFSASFYLLCRYEEYLPHVKDELGRYPVTESLGYKESFLQQPVVDIWAYKLKRILVSHFPKLIFEKRNFIEHHLIASPQPYKYIQKGLVRSIIGGTRDLAKFRLKSFYNRLKVLTLGNDPNDTFSWLITTIKNRPEKFTFFFMLGESVDYSESITTYSKRFKSLLKFVSDYKEVGLVFSNDGLDDYEIKKKEKRQLEAITNRTVKSTMNTELRVSLPDFYRDLVELEVEKDFTMVYQNTPGYRAGTCTPFLFYDLDYEIRTPLTIHPIAFTTNSLKTKHYSQVESLLNKFRSQVLQVQGTFSILFTNTDFIDVPENKSWRLFFTENS